MENRRLTDILALFKRGAGSRFVWVLLCILVVSVVPAHATLVNIDQIIYQNGTGVDPTKMSGTLDITVSGAQQLTIVMTNTSLDSAFTDSGAPALMLLTGFGIQLGGVDITGGTVTVGAGETALNFDVGQSLTDISNQWGFANTSTDGYNLSGVLSVDGITSSISQGGAQTRFAGPPPTSIDGPGYGAISANETQFGSSQPGVRDSITFVLNLSGAAPTVAAIDAGNVVLAFGSPDTRTGVIPEPSTYALYGLGISMLLVSGWWQKRRRQGSIAA